MILRYAAISVVLSAVLLAGCLPPTPEPPEPVDLQAEYAAAIDDARVADPGEIVRDLTAIVPYDDALIRDAQGNVLVVTWTSWSGYDNLAGQATTLTREVWVTVAPELKDWVRNNDVGPDDLILRLEQLLGVPANGGKDRFVELWVAPGDLFRPSADPEITDHEAELSFPEPAGTITISDTYVQWFTNLMNTSYGGNGYPWTRLGYTYDWGDSADHVGLSEFVIRKGATVTVSSVTGNEDYCRWWE